MNTTKPTKKYGRHPDCRNAVYTTLDDTDYEIIKEQSDEKGIPIAEIVRNAVKLYLWGKE